MIPEVPPLDVVQRWMMAVITHPAGVHSGIDSPEAQQQINLLPSQLENVITRSRSCTSLQRLSVYGNAYFARLIECMAADFPATSHAVSEEAFAAFVVGYLQRYPSRSDNLSRLGDSFPDYLEETRPEREQTDDIPGWPEFLVDLAKLERLYNEVFHGPGEEREPTLTPENVRALPIDRWESVRLVTSESLKLIELRFPVHEYITAVRRGESAEVPAPTQTWLAVNRRDYVVRRHPLNEVQYRLLSALRLGKPLGDAIEEAVEVAPDPIDDLVQQLEHWFKTWTMAGYFREIR